MRFRDSGIYLTFDDVSLVPRKSSVRTRSDVSLKSGRLSLEVPVISANMDTVTGPQMAKAMFSAGGLGILHRFKPLDQVVDDIRMLLKYNVIFGASVGVGPAAMEWVTTYAEMDVPILCIDVAHGHHEMVIDLLRQLPKGKFREVIAGNVCTGRAASDLAEAGATIIKVGVGPGSHCTTRIITGHGIPQLSAIADCVAGISGSPKVRDAEIIADGGLRTSGDIAKALAAGANYVMSGSLFAGCDETPAPYATLDGKRCKVYRGSASFEAQSARDSKKTIIAEGVASRVAAKGPVAGVVDELAGGLRSAFSYCGVDNMADFQKHAQFVHVTGSGLREARPEIW